MKTRTNFLRTLFWTLPILAMGVACSKDDDNETMATWQMEVDQVRASTAKYADVSVAINEGFFDASGFVPNMGHHYVLPARMDGTFELEKPEIILYAPDANGNMEFVAVEYAVPIEDLDNPGLPPEGFTGDLDEWEVNPHLSQWQLHVWLVKENPDGIFAPHNPAIGDGN